MLLGFLRQMTGSRCSVGRIGSKNLETIVWRCKMYRRISMVSLIVLLLSSLMLSSSVVSAQDPSPQHSDPTWQAS